MSRCSSCVPPGRDAPALDLIDLAPEEDGDRPRGNFVRTLSRHHRPPSMAAVPLASHQKPPGPPTNKEAASLSSAAVIRSRSRFCSKPSPADSWYWASFPRERHLQKRAPGPPKERRS